MPWAMGSTRPVGVSWFLMGMGLHLLWGWGGVHAIKELHPPRPLPPLTTVLPRIFGGPPLQSTTVTVPPVFKQENNTELHSQVGTTAVLHCATEHVGENTVSWVRRRDYHLLTVGPVAYSTDQRFSVRHIKADNDWQLHIRYVQKRDEGVYECQIATHPPISLLSTLHVVEATSEILGGPEKYMTMGSSLRLVCVLRKNTQPPTYVFWYHNDRMINYDSKVKVDTGGEVSVLFLGEVGPQSSGNYTCTPSNTQSSHIIVHVLRGGETPAAIHSGASSATVLPSGLTMPLLFSLASLEQEEKLPRTQQKCQDLRGIGSSTNVLDAASPSRPAESSPCHTVLGDAQGRSLERRIGRVKDVLLLKDVLALANGTSKFIRAYRHFANWVLAYANVMMSFMLNVMGIVLKSAIPLVVVFLHSWSTKFLHLNNNAKLTGLCSDLANVRVKDSHGGFNINEEKGFLTNSICDNHVYKVTGEEKLYPVSQKDEGSNRLELTFQNGSLRTIKWHNHDFIRKNLTHQRVCKMMKSFEEIHASSHRKKYPKFN